MQKYKKIDEKYVYCQVDFQNLKRNLHVGNSNRYLYNNITKEQTKVKSKFSIFALVRA